MKGTQAFKRSKTIDKGILVAWMTLMIIIPVLHIGPELFAPTLYNGDARTGTFVFWQNHNPALFQEDPIAAYVRATMMPPGYTALGKLFTTWSPHPLIGMHLLMFVLVIFTAASVFLCAYKLGGKWAGGLTVVLFLQGPAWNTISGAFPRGFCFLLLSATLACWLWRWEKGALLIQFAAALLYPTAYVMLALAGGLRVLWGLWRRTLTRFAFLSFLFVHVVALSTLLLWIQQNPYGSPISGRETLLSDPHWNGEKPRLGAHYEFGSVTSHLLITAQVAMPFSAPNRVLNTTTISFLMLGIISSSFLMLGIISSLGMIFFLAWRRGGVIRLNTLQAGAKQAALTCREMLPLLIAVVILYGLAQSFPLWLYFPLRYFTFGLTLIALLGGVYLSVFLVRIFVGQSRRLKRIARFLLYGIVLFSTVAEFQRKPSEYGFWDHVVAERAGILQAVSALPETSEILAPGPLAEDIPLFCARPVVWNLENYISFHNAFINALDARIRSAVDAILTPEWPVASRQLLDLGVTHLVYDKALWRVPEERASILLSPLLEQYGHRLTVAQPEDLIWQHIPAQNLIFEDEHYKLWSVRTEELLGGN